MKNGKRLTRKEKEYFASCRLNPSNWLRIKETKEYIEYQNKNSGKIRRVAK